MHDCHPIRSTIKVLYNQVFCYFQASCLYNLFVESALTIFKLTYYLHDTKVISYMTIQVKPNTSMQNYTYKSYHHTGLMENYVLNMKCPERSYADAEISSHPRNNSSIYILCWTFWVCKLYYPCNWIYNRFCVQKLGIYVQCNCIVKQFTI